MKKVELELVARADKAIKELEDLKSELESIKKSTDDIDKTTSKGFSKLGKRIKSIGNGFKGASLAAKGFVMALGGKILDKFFEILQQNQVIVDGMAVAFGTVANVMNQVINVVLDAGSNFTGLGKILKANVMIPINLVRGAFYGIQKGILLAQAAWEMSPFGGKDVDKITELNKKLDENQEALDSVGESLSGNFSQLYEGVTETASQFGDFVEDVSEGIKEIDVLQTAANQKRLQQLRNETELALAENDKLQFEYQLQAEQQRQIRDDVTASIEDRTAANEELGRVLKEQFGLQEANALKAIELAEAELAANPKSIANKVALIEAEKNLADVRENIAGFESEQRVNAEALELEAIELINTKKEAENARLIAKKKNNAEEIEDEVKKLQELKSIAEQERDIEQKRLQEQIERLGEGTQARQDAEQQLLDFQQQKAFEIAEIDKQIQDQKDVDAEKEKERDRLVQEAKIALTQNTLGLIQQIVGENSRVGKAAAIAQAIINSYQGFTEVLASKSVLPQPLASIEKIVSAGTILASGLQTVQKIASTEIPGGGGSSSTPRGAASAPQAPAFNVVGASPENQLAEAIGQTTDQPVKAYVVSEEVSNAQALDRKIIKKASIG